MKRRRQRKRRKKRRINSWQALLATHSVSCLVCVCVRGVFEDCVYICVCVCVWQKDLQPQLPAIYIYELYMYKLYIYSFMCTKEFLSRLIADVFYSSKTAESVQQAHAGLYDSTSYCQLSQGTSRDRSQDRTISILDTRVARFGLFEDKKQIWPFLKKLVGLVIFGSLLSSWPFFKVYWSLYSKKNVFLS